MKRIILAIIILTAIASAEGQKNYALLVIDVQNFYFPGGRSELVEPEKSAEKAAIAISEARQTGNPVIFIQHKSASGMEINDLVKPMPGEKIFIKEEVNSFLGGMQTQMCVEAAVRAAHDFGFGVILLHDACATRNLKFGDREVAAADVHASTLATLKSYGTVLSVSEWIEKVQGNGIR